jgi:hypothetical protein
LSIKLKRKSSTKTRLCPSFLFPQNPTISTLDMSSAFDSPGLALQQALEELTQTFERKRKPSLYHRNTPTSKRCPQHPIPCLVPHYEPMHGTTTSQAVAVQAALKKSLSNPIGFPLTLTPDEKQFIIDTGASITIMNSNDDYITPITPVQRTELKGIASGLTVQGIGTAQYIFLDDKGADITLVLPNMLFVPNLPIRLLCP